MIISERIFKLLKQKKMLQSDFSMETGIPQSTISSWKTHKTNPHSDKIMAICRALGVTPEQILTGKDIDAELEEIL